MQQDVNAMWHSPISSCSLGHAHTQPCTYTNTLFWAWSNELMNPTQPWLISWIIKHGWYQGDSICYVHTLSQPVYHEYTNKSVQRLISTTNWVTPLFAQLRRNNKHMLRIWKWTRVFHGLSWSRLMQFSIGWTPDAGAAAEMGTGLVLVIDWA